MIELTDINGDPFDGELDLEIIKDFIFPCIYTSDISLPDGHGRKTFRGRRWAADANGVISKIQLEEQHEGKVVALAFVRVATIDEYIRISRDKAPALVRSGTPASPRFRLMIIQNRLKKLQNLPDL